MTYSAKSDLSGTISQFTRRKGIIINSGSSLPSYQIKLTISYEPSMQTDFRDIRFNDISGNYCSYWIESKTNSSTATVWIKIDLVTGSNTAYMYYGNGSITSASDGNNTFIQYHGAATSPFLDSLIVPPTNIVYETYVSFTSDNTNIRYGVSNNANFLAGDSAGLGFYTYTGSYLLWNLVCNNGTYTSNNTSVTYSTWNKIMLKLSDTTFKGYLNNVETGTALSTNLPNETMGIGAQIVSGTGTISQQYSFVRKYAPSEPTACVAEEVLTLSWLASWNRRKPMTITGSTNVQTDYQMKLIVHKSAGTDTSTDIYLGTHVNNDFSDLRFTKNDGTTLLNHWIESYTSGSIATVWIKIPLVPISPCTSTIYLYYDNSSATPQSNGVNTFDFFDDFEDGSISDWTQQSGAGASISSTVVKSGTYSMKVNPTTAWAETYKNVPTINTTSGDRVIELWAYVNSTNGQGIGITVETTGGTYIPSFTYGFRDTSYLGYYDTAWRNMDVNTAYSLNTWYKLKMVTHMGVSSSTYDYYIYDTNLNLVAQKIGAAQRGTVTSLGAISFATNASALTYYDNIIVRKYASPEPTFSTIGVEQTPPIITATNMIITPSETPCRHGICTVTVSVTWTNNGGSSGSFVPNITVDNVAIYPAPFPSEVLGAGSSISRSFTIYNLTTGTRNICPYPN